MRLKNNLLSYIYAYGAPYAYRMPICVWDWKTSHTRMGRPVRVRVIPYAHGTKYVYGTEQGSKVVANDAKFKFIGFMVSVYERPNHLVAEVRWLTLVTFTMCLQLRQPEVVCQNYSSVTASRNNSPKYSQSLSVYNDSYREGRCSIIMTIDIQ